MPSSRKRRGSRNRRLACLLAAIASLLTACSEPQRRQVAGGDPALGPSLIRDYGCQACHLIPGVAGADALVGPPLIHWSGRVYIAGHIPNTPENLVRWIMNPQAYAERTVMPNMGVTEPDARHIAAYLFTLR